MKHVSRYIDLGFCLVFLPLMILIFPVERWWATYPVFLTLFVGWLYVTYFVYTYYIVPRLFHGRKPRLHALMAVGVSVGVTLLFASYDITSPFYHLRMQHPGVEVGVPKLGVRQNQQAVWLHYILVVIFCLAVGMLTEAYRQRLAREEVELARNKAELALYKAQINPHFLFNTLNTLYGLLITHSDKTEATLERFINLTKYMYHNANHDFIALSEEQAYIGQYIDLQRLRLNHLAEVDYVCEVADGSVPVPPMLLITFVENAFKYGISSNEPCFVHIRLCQAGDTIRFEVRNSVFDHAHGSSKRMGIDNCRRRLSLLYPDRHHLDIHRDEDGTFCVSLQLTNENLC